MGMPLCDNKKNQFLEASTTMELSNQNLYLSMLWCLIFIIIVLKLISTRSNKPNPPPCPPKLPFIGNLHQITGTLTQISLRSLSQKYGPLMLLHFGQIPTLVVSSANLVREMATTNDVVFSSRPSMTVARIFYYGCKDLSFSPYGEDWKYKRKLSIIEFLSSKKVRSFQLIREEEVANLVNKIPEACRKNIPVNLIKMLVATSGNIHCRCVFGHKYETLDGKSSRLEELVMDLMHHFGEFSFGDFFPSLWWMDFVTGLIPRMKANFRELEAFIDKEIQQHKGGKMNIENKDFVDCMLQLQHEDDTPNVGLSLPSIKTLILDMVAGGWETTSTAIEWVMAELMKNPEKMKKAQEEVRRVVGNKPKIEENDVNQMSYLRCVVKETMRLHPPGPLLLARKTDGSVKLGGYDIPPKTRVIVNAWAIQRDPDVWERPEEFTPERFENSEVDFKGQDFELIPFGFGRRVCPGILFSVASIEYTLVNLLYWFDWKLPDNNNGTKDESGKDIDISETKGMLAAMKLPLLLQPVPYCPKT
ncbi:cytochrome P450 71A1-like [Prosopis cineraria]|uniref:cytochrome P450 71A1-like n=1 Tax=Prosopis cineraria TaxID=364024 RepID=UPI0024100ED8|nr:cytochrome P450 71A1-like [Prosopis cineraria]